MLLRLAALFAAKLASPGIFPSYCGLPPPKHSKIFPCSRSAAAKPQGQSRCSQASKLCPQIERQAAISAAVAIGKISSEIRFKLKLQDCMTDVMKLIPSESSVRKHSEF